MSLSSYIISSSLNKLSFHGQDAISNIISNRRDKSWGGGVKPLYQNNEIEEHKKIIIFRVTKKQKRYIVDYI